MVAELQIEPWGHVRAAYRAYTWNCWNLHRHLLLLHLCQLLVCSTVADDGDDQDLANLAAAWLEAQRLVLRQTWNQSQESPRRRCWNCLEIPSAIHRGRAPNDCKPWNESVGSNCTAKDDIEIALEPSLQSHSSCDICWWPQQSHGLLFNFAKTCAPHKRTIFVIRVSKYLLGAICLSGSMASKMVRS